MLSWQRDFSADRHIARNQRAATKHHNDIIITTRAQRAYRARNIAYINIGGGMSALLMITIIGNIVS